ncbi:hypothetical protein BDW02DRAFT_489883 [Decorospora gaudefroyi]|uniref:Pru domain-containing protein n=1 Tax=Decorospora gaudefroyi TaxID=184978 RepID=A0A6A5KUD1_9PLEO|nr:hypothetical protein BDW02DRAFT_489883 [Decorospora gaudefroyi]
MSIQPLITFKAGQCELSRGEGNQQTVKPLPTPGYVYLYQGEDEFVHFCWRPRDRPLEQSELDLIMIPSDGSFQPYTGKDSPEDSEEIKSPTDGRIFVLKFSSSSQRYLFWLQSKSQHPRGASWFSDRDFKIGQVVDLLLTGEEIDVQAELAQVSNTSGGNDEDETMEDVEGVDHSSSRNRHGSTGGAGAGATGGDVREEGEGSREGGADGGRAAASGDVNAIVNDFMNSLKGGSMGSGSQQKGSAPFTTLLDLLWPSHTLPAVQGASDEIIDALCAQLPTTPFLLEADVEDIEQIDPNSETAQMAIQTLSREEKIDVLGSILRAPQLRSALGSLTEALKTGALPTVSQALNIDVENGGYKRGGGMPLGGGDAVKAFLEGVKKTVEKEKKGDDDMDTS